MMSKVMSGYDILLKHNVTRLCHYTKLKNLEDIITLKHGILSRQRLIDEGKLDATDARRFDGKLEYVNCTVQYPNSWLLNQNRDPSPNSSQQWVVLFIDLQILERVEADEAIFCPGNASKKCGKYISKNMDGVESIFAYSVPTYEHKRPSNMISSCPTDGQAEIMIKNCIPYEYITGIATESEDLADKVSLILEESNAERIKVYVAPDVITTRWSDMVRNGQIPKEEEYKGWEFY